MTVGVRFHAAAIRRPPRGPRHDQRERILNKTIAPEHFQAFRRLLEDSCGILLGDNKQYLVTSRLGPLMAAEEVTDLGMLVQRLQRPSERVLRGRVIEAMTTNETSWFRDVYPFENLQKHVFPALADTVGRRIRIWSAACSSGQEPYSISMALHESRTRGLSLEAEIIATDLAPSMVEMTRHAVYPESAIRRGLSPDRLQRFFQRQGDGWQVKPEIRARVRPQVQNLLEPFGTLGRFDMIFCRNVLIYFSPRTREDILRRMCRQLNPGGYLIVGASESLSRHMDDLEMVRGDSGVMYRRRQQSTV